MPIDTNAISALEFCILVAWVRGMTVGKISRYIGIHYGVSEGAIRGIITRKMSLPRADMTKERRQHVLDQLLEHRIDSGKLGAEMFVAMPIKSKAGGNRVKSLSHYRPKKPTPVTQDISSVSASRRRKLEQRAVKMREAKIVEEKEAKEKRELGHNPARGIFSTPLEFMDSTGLLSDETVHRNLRDMDRNPVEMTRLNAGRKMREIFTGCQMSGMKSQDFEMVGGGTGLGVAIPAKVQEYTSIAMVIAKMVQPEDFRDLRRMLVEDEFVWKTPSKKASEITLQSLRRALDAVGLYFDMISDRGFEARWGYLPAIGTAKTRSQARQASTDAREMINRAQRKMK
jgi:hypothetical protein